MRNKKLRLLVGQPTQEVSPQHVGLKIRLVFWVLGPGDGDRPLVVWLKG